MFDFLLNLVQEPGYLDEKKRSELLQALSKSGASTGAATTSADTEADVESTTDKTDAKESSDDTA